MSVAQEETHIPFLYHYQPFLSIFNILMKESTVHCVPEWNLPSDVVFKLFLLLKLKRRKILILTMA